MTQSSAESPPAENGELLAVVLDGVTYPVVNGLALEHVGLGHTEASRLERPHASGDDHGAGIEARAENGFHVESAILALAQRDDFLPEMQRGIKRRDLLQQAVDQFLSPAGGQGGYVIDRLVGVQLGALPAGRAQRIHEVAGDSQQSELEHLEQPARAGTDDHDFSDDRRLRKRLGQKRILDGNWARNHIAMKLNGRCLAIGRAAAAATHPAIGL